MKLRTLPSWLYTSQAVSRGRLARATTRIQAVAKRGYPDTEFDTKLDTGSLGNFVQGQPLRITLSSPHNEAVDTLETFDYRRKVRIVTSKTFVDAAQLVPTPSLSANKDSDSTPGHRFTIDKWE